MIEAEGLYYCYEKNGDYVLNDLNFKIDRGEFVFIIGASGAGNRHYLN